MAALTIAQYYNILAAEKATFSTLTALQPNIDDTQTLLADLTTNSKVASWRLDLWIMAFCAWIIASAFDQFVIEVDTKVNAAAPGTTQWLQKKLLEFQIGYELTFVNDVPTYSTIDLSARIVAQAAVVENALGLVICKLAKDDGSGNLIALDAPELAAVDSYIRQIKCAGTIHLSISLNADLIKLTGAEVKYDAILGLSVIQINVVAAVIGYLKNLPFNGKVNINKLMDAIQTVPGVVGVVLPTFDCADAGGVYSTYNYDYQTVAGYIIEDPANSIISTVTWTAA